MLLRRTIVQRHGSLPKCPYPLCLHWIGNEKLASQYQSVCNTTNCLQMSAGLIALLLRPIFEGHDQVKLGMPRQM
jgi:hypothetical protein